MSNQYDSLIQKMLQHFAGPQFKEELNAAKIDFFGTRNVSEDDAIHFEARINLFFDWYFFTRELSGYGQTPLYSCFMVRELRFNPEEIELIDHLKNHRHSLFELIKIKEGDIYVKDLFYDEKVWIRNSPLIYGFEKDEIFEARLIPNSKEWIFSKGFCFHPAEAKTYILNEVKNHRNNRDLDFEKFIFRLMKMRFRVDQYRHLRPESIYSNDSKLGSLRE